jgi:hypothetical protein
MMKATTILHWFRKIRTKNIVYSIEIALVIFNLILSFVAVNGYCSKFTEIQTTDIENAGDFLKNHSKGNETILCVHPGYAYYSGLNYIMLPYIYPNGSSDWDIFSIDDYPKEYREARPYYMFRPDNDHKIDYLVIDLKTIQECVPLLKDHFNESSWRVDNYILIGIYNTDKCAIFEVGEII